MLSEDIPAPTSFNGNLLNNCADKTVWLFFELSAIMCFSFWFLKFHHELHWVVKIIS